MHKRITKPQLRKLIKEQGTVEIELFERDRLRHLNSTSGMVTPTMLVVNVSNIEELETRLPETFKKSFGHTDFIYSVWVEDE